jgi:hypothetical protein
MLLADSERRLLLAARKVFETGEPVFYREYPHSEPVESQDISLSLAIDASEKYFQGSYPAYRLARERIWRKLGAVSQRRGFWARSFLMENGFRTWVDSRDKDGVNRIKPGNVTEENFNNWCVLATMAYIDRILDTGEIK